MPVAQAERRDEERPDSKLLREKPRQRSRATLPFLIGDTLTAEGKPGRCDFGFRRVPLLVRACTLADDPELDDSLPAALNEKTHAEHKTAGCIQGTVRPRTDRDPQAAARIGRVLPP